MSFDAKIQFVIASHLGCDESSITPEARLREDLRADSFDVIELLQQLEETFATTVDEKAATTIRTVSDLMAYMSRLLDEASPSARLAGRRSA
jgi:acyl carrier protein